MIAVDTSLLAHAANRHVREHARAAAVLEALDALARNEAQVRSVDLNPLIIVDGRPVAVDALVEVAP